MKERFNIRLSVYFIDIFEDTPKNTIEKEYILKIEIRCKDSETCIGAPLKDLENFRAHHEFLLRLPKEAREEFLEQCPVAFKFIKNNHKFGESVFKWNKEFCEEISQKKFSANKFIHVVPIFGPDQSTVGQFKLCILATKGSVLDLNAREKTDSVIEKDDMLFAICDDGEPEWQECKVDPKHECVGGLINLTGLAIENGDRVKLSEIEGPDGQLPSDAQSLHYPAKGNEYLVPPGDAKDRNNPQLMSTTASPSLPFCSRLCDDVFGVGQLSRHSTPISSRNSNEMLSIRRAVSIIRGWGKTSKGEYKLNTIQEEDEDDTCSHIKDCMQMLHECEEDYDAKELKSRGMTRAEQMKFCYRNMDPDFKKRPRKSYVKWLGKRPLIHRNSHKYCTRKAEVVPANMGWMWNVPIVGLNARNGWRPGYIHAKIKKLMDYFLMPLSYQASTDDAFGTSGSLRLKENDGGWPTHGAKEKIIMGKMVVERDPITKQKCAKIEVPNAVKSYIEEEVGRRAKKQVEPVHLINQETQYTVRDYMPWKKVESDKKQEGSKKISSVIGKPSEKSSKLPRYKGKPTTSTELPEKSLANQPIKPNATNAVKTAPLKAAKFEKVEKNEKTQKAGKIEKIQKPEKKEKSEKIQKIEKVVEKPEKVQKGEKAQKPLKIEKAPNKDPKAKGGKKL